jgi:hypothetical protein
MKRLALLLALAAVNGCGDDDEQRATAAKTPPGCEAAVPKAPKELPDGFPRPSAEVVATSRASDTGTVVDGFVAALPGDVVDDLAGKGELNVLFQEDEGDDAEVTVSDGRHRTAFKLVKACAGGSRFSAVVAAEAGASSETDGR